jgi:cytochrome P450
MRPSAPPAPRPAPERRLAALSRHLTTTTTTSSSSSPASVSAAAAAGEIWEGGGGAPMFAKEVTDTMAQTMQFLCMLPYPDLDRRIGEALITQLPCPMHDAALVARYPDFTERMHRCIVNGNRFGVGTHNIYETEMSKYLGRWGQNYLMPGILPRREDMPYKTWLVVVNDHEDCARLARTHTRKSRLYDGTFLRDSVLGTRDDESWTKQRNHLVEAFLPFASLAKIFPVSNARSQLAIEQRLPELIRAGAAGAGGAGSVEIGDFWLHEAMAQLQLALLGETEEYMNETNRPLRQAFGLALSSAPSLQQRLADMEQGTEYIHDYADKLVEHALAPGSRGRYVGPDESARGQGPVNGPLTSRLQTIAAAVEGVPSGSEHIPRDVAAAILFAGHDTTANMMTWTTFEMARKPHLQRRLASECDAWFARIGGRDIVYEDLMELEFMTRVLTETLRFWPSVPNGTFRETMFEDTVAGPNGERVTLPAGTNLKLGEWSMHMDPALWGDDVNEYNPDRSFLEGELCGGTTGVNPQSHRFAPFTFMPRSCIGRNFAMMEARILLARFFHQYEVSLAEPTLSAAPTCRGIETFMGKNVGSMGPRNGMHVVLRRRRGR